jgi:glycerol-3-phosphate dehydrogenase
MRRSAALDACGSLRPERLRGAFTYTDGVEDDARLALAVARTARRAGAVVVTRARASATGGASSAEVELHDDFTGATSRVHARVVIDATGASQPDELLVPSRGSHMLVPRERIPSSMGMTIRVPGRVIFLIPWYRHWIIGTTDVPHPGELHRPRATPEEIDYLLEHTNAAMQVHLTRDDIVATYAGIRPLAARHGRSPLDTVRASREHRIERRDGIVYVRGGKLTTYRLVARDTVNVALGGLRRGQVGTENQPLVGAAPAAQLLNVRSTLERSYGLRPGLAARLVERHGTDAAEIARQSVRRGLLRELDGSSGYLEGEVLWAVRQEMALSLDDVLARRLRLALEARDHGVSVGRRVAEIMGDELRWTAARRSSAVSEYAAAASREYGVPGREGVGDRQERVAV